MLPKGEREMRRKDSISLLEQSIIGVVANQNAKKLDANNYTTSMIGLKYKLAHKRADKNNCNASENAQRKRLIEILQQLIEQVKMKVVGASKIT
jgi:hypothetical protein